MGCKMLHCGSYSVTNFNFICRVLKTLSRNFWRTNRSLENITAEKKIDLSKSLTSTIFKIFFQVPRKFTLLFESLFTIFVKLLKKFSKFPQDFLFLMFLNNLLLEILVKIRNNFVNVYLNSFPYFSNIVFKIVS